MAGRRVSVARVMIPPLSDFDVPRALRTASRPSTAAETALEFVASPWMISIDSVTFGGSRTSAAAAWPASSACRTS